MLAAGRKRPHDRFMLLFSSTERSTARFGVHLDCKVVRERDFRVIGRGSLDLSLTGILVQATYDAEVGDEVIVSFQTPQLEEWVDAVGLVTRRLEGRRRGDLGMAIGVTFLSIDDDSLRALARFLERTPVAPRRSPRLDFAREVQRIASL